MKTATVVLIILLALVISGNALAQSEDEASSEPVILTDELGRYPLRLYMDILEDPSGDLTIDDITSPEYISRFVRSDVAVPNFGYTDSAYWVRLPIRNESYQSDQWLLELAFASMNFVDL